MFEAESPKAHATRLYNEIMASRGDKAENVALIAQALRDSKAQGLEELAKELSEYPSAFQIRNNLLVRVKELRGRSLELA